MKIQVFKFRYQREHLKSNKRIWVKEVKEYHYEVAEEVVKFIESWNRNNDHSQFQSNR